MHRIAASFAASAMILGAAAPALADYRPFVWTYWYDTPTQGERELEYKFRSADLTKTEFKHLIALEFGLTDEWGFEPYVVLSQTDKGVDFSGLKVQTRYRMMGESDFLPGATAYLEMERTDKAKTEAKLILGRTFGPLLVGTNFIVEKEFANKAADFGYTAGTVVNLGDWLYLGAEAKGGKLTGTIPEHRFGPTVVVKAGGFMLGANYLFDPGRNDSAGNLVQAHQGQFTGSVEF